MIEEKILIIGPSWVGDMVMAQGLFKALKRRYPNSIIDVLAPAWSAPLTARMPEINESIPLPLLHGELGLRKRFNLAKSVKARGYQRCYVLPNSFKSALIPFAAKIKVRTGWRGEWRYGLLNDIRVLDKKRYPLMIQRYIALSVDKNETNQPLLIPSLQVESAGVKQALTKYGLAENKQPILVLCPGAEFGPSKRWPENYYGALAKYYLAHNWQVWILGSPKDSEVAQQIQMANDESCQDLTGKTSLGETIDLMSQANLVVSNDSGLMHIAAALERPLVALYGSTSPQFTPPLVEKVEILQESLPCSPCFKRTCPLQHHQCMQQLSVDKVIEAAQRLVAMC
jgi:heptosyltransferase II